MRPKIHDYSAAIEVPLPLAKFIKSERRQRSHVSVSDSRTGSKAKIIITASDPSAFKAALNSALRDLTIVESVSKAADKRRRRKA